MESIGVFFGKGNQHIMFPTAPITLSRGGQWADFSYILYYFLLNFFFSFFERDIYRLRLDKSIL